MKVSIRPQEDRGSGHADALGFDTCESNDFAGDLGKLTDPPAAPVSASITACVSSP